MLLAGIAIFAFVLIGPSYAKAVDVNIPAPNNVISPFQSQIMSYTVWGAADPTKQVYLGSSTPGRLFIPSSPKYPMVQCWATQPFLVGSDGHQIFADQNQYVVNPADNIGVRFEDGSMKYLRVQHVAVDIAVRTFKNLPQAVDYSNKDPNTRGKPGWSNKYPVHPFCTDYGTSTIVLGGYAPGTGYQFSPSSGFSGAGFDFDAGIFCSPSSGSTNNRFVDSNGNQPYGVLGIDFDYGANPFGRAWQPPYDVGITTSLENFNDLTTADYNLRHNYGNSLIKVVPKLDFQAINNYLTYNYYKPVENVGVFQVLTGDTQMAILDAWISQDFTKAGKVNSYTTSANFTAALQVINADADHGNPSDPATLVTPTTQNTPGYTTTTVQYWYKYAGKEPAYYIDGQIIPPVDFLERSHQTATGINLDNFADMPTNMWVTIEQYLQPYTISQWAYYQGRAAWFAHYFVGTPCGQTRGPDYATWTDKFPFRLTVENTYMVTRVVFKIAVFTDNQVYYVPATGSPVKVENLVDYGINSVGVLTPNFDDAGGSFSLTYFDPLGALFGLLPLIITLAMVIIGAVVIIPVVMKARRGGASGQQPPKRTNPRRKLIIALVVIIAVVIVAITITILAMT